MTLSNLRLIEWLKIAILASIVFFITACDSEILSTKTTEENSSESITNNQSLTVYLNDKEVMDQFLNPSSNKAILLHDSLALYPQNIKIQNNILSLEYIVKNKAEQKLLAVNFFSIVSLTNNDIPSKYKVIHLSLPINFNFLRSITIGSSIKENTLRDKTSIIKPTPAVTIKKNGKKSLDLEQHLIKLPKLSSFSLSSLPQGGYLKIKVTFDLNELYLNSKVPLLVKTLNSDNYSFSGIRTLVTSAFYEDLGLLDFTNDMSQDEDKEEIDNNENNSTINSESQQQ